ncbi:MAG TPA: lipopolysaccharide biosynthesis protein [Ferrovibrio sp.]|uniref:lipopolysaccharide biosynthesis protein n=1 Tax=Ferrovibrio sp. TaxID=1917215 RepID=UPI002ECFDA58
MANGLKTRSIKGLLWSASEGIGVAALSLGSFAFLARLLEPGDFGIVALGSAFIICFNLIIGHSFVDAVVQQPQLTPEHLDTAFWSTIGAAILLTLFCLAGAGAVATLLHEPKLAVVLPWLGTVLVVNALGAVPIAIFRRELHFRTLAMCTLSGRATGAAASIAMAFTGFGLWSLVAQQVIAGIVTSLVVSVAARWRPRFRFSLRYLREMGQFGFHVSTSQVISGLGEQALTLLIGSLFGSVVLGHFSVAWRIVQLIRSLVATAVYQVAFSTFAKLQNDRPAMIRAFMKATRLSCLVGFPIGIGMAVTARPAIFVLFGGKWESSIPIFAILALDMVPAFFLIFVSASYRSMGRPAWALYAALVYFVVGIGGMTALSHFGIVAVTAFWVIKSFALLPLHLVLTRKLLGIPLRHFVSAAAPPLAASAVMAACAAAILWAMRDIHYAPAQLAAAALGGALSYVLATRLFAPSLFQDALQTGRIMITPGSKHSAGTDTAQNPI